MTNQRSSTAVAFFVAAAVLVPFILYTGVLWGGGVLLQHAIAEAWPSASKSQLQMALAITPFVISIASFVALRSAVPRVPWLGAFIYVPAMAVALIYYALSLSGAYI